MDGKREKNEKEEETNKEEEGEKREKVCYESRSEEIAYEEIQ